MIQTIKDLVSAKADTTVALAKEIWGYAEPSYCLLYTSKVFGEFFSE